MRKTLALILTLTAIPFIALAQVADDEKNKSEKLNQMLSEQVERLAEDGDEEIDFEELVNDYIFYSENPININNDAELDRLAELRIIGPSQIESIKNYRWRFGDFAIMEELSMVEGIDERTAELLKPLVCIKNDDKDTNKVTGMKMRDYGKHQITALYSQVLESQKGYERASDSALLASPSSHYLGSPQRYMIRYSYNYRNKIRIGFVAEKDPGEALFYGKYSDTIKNLIGSHRNYGFDFYGLYAYINDFGIVRDAVLGDYQLSFGQGLTLWNGMSYGKIGAGSSTIKQARGVKPKTSASETGFMRGAAATLHYKGVSLTAFYSIRAIDANLNSVTDTIDDTEQYVTSLQETGYHRTISELQDRHAIRQQVFGGHVSYANKHFEVGYTAYHTLLSQELILKPSKYNSFYFQGKKLTVQGIDFKYVISKLALYGEASMSGTTGFAGLIGFTASPTGYINFTMTYRNYGKKYQNLFSNAFGESSRNQGEEGWYIGLQATPLPYWRILAYADFYRFKWLTSQVYAPSWGQEYYIKTEHQINKKTSLYLLFRSKSKMKNSATESYSYFPIPYNKKSVRFNISYQFGDFKLSNKVQYSHFNDGDGNKSNGYFVCQDISYKPTRFKVPFGFTFRYALFDTDDYDSRLYAYENDVLYNFSVPAFYDKGMRIYLLGNVKLFNALSLYARIGCTFYSNKDEISSGPTLITSNHRTDLKVEAIYKF